MYISRCNSFEYMCDGLVCYALEFLVCSRTPLFNGYIQLRSRSRSFRQEPSCKTLNTLYSNSYYCCTTAAQRNSLQDLVLARGIGVDCIRNYKL